MGVERGGMRETLRESSPLDGGGESEMESWRPSSAVTEELILSVADELEARAREANAVALSLRLAAHVAPSDKAGEDADYDARVGEILLRAHTILAGDLEVARHQFPRPPLPPSDAEPPPLSSEAVSSDRVRQTLPFGPESEPAPPMSSGPPPNTSGVRRQKGSPASEPKPSANANERTPKGFATQELNRWYEGLTRLTRD